LLFHISTILSYIWSIVLSSFFPTRNIHRDFRSFTRVFTIVFTRRSSAMNGNSGGMELYRHYGGLADPDFVVLPTDDVARRAAAL